MSAAAKPPEGSRLLVQWIDGKQTIVAPPRSRGALLIILAVFLSFWLCVWTLGAVAIGARLALGDGSAFEGFWLGGWALGEAFALFILYRILRPPIPERFILQVDGLAYNSGVAPPRMRVRYNRILSWRDVWPKRMRRVFPCSDLNTLRLRESADGNRLTVDAGADRFDLAKDCTEVEREWLFQTLTDYYRLADDRRKA